MSSESFSLRIENIYIYMITTAIFLRFPIIPREYLILGSSNMHNREESRIIGEERTVSSAINNSKQCRLPSCSRVIESSCERN